MSHYYGTAEPAVAQHKAAHLLLELLISSQQEQGGMKRVILKCLGGVPYSVNFRVRRD